MNLFGQEVRGSYGSRLLVYVLYHPHQQSAITQHTTIFLNTINFPFYHTSRCNNHLTTILAILAQILELPASVHFFLSLTMDHKEGSLQLWVHVAGTCTSSCYSLWIMRKAACSFGPMLLVLALRMQQGLLVFPRASTMSISLTIRPDQSSNLTEPNFMVEQMIKGGS